MCKHKDIILVGDKNDINKHPIKILFDITDISFSDIADPDKCVGKDIQLFG